MNEGWGKVTAEEEDDGGVKKGWQRGRQGSDIVGIFGIESPLLW